MPLEVARETASKFYDLAGTATKVAVGLCGVTPSTARERLRRYSIPVLAAGALIAAAHGELFVWSFLSFCPIFSMKPGKMLIFFVFTRKKRKKT